MLVLLDGRSRGGTETKTVECLASTKLLVVTGYHLNLTLCLHTLLPVRPVARHRSVSSRAPGRQKVSTAVRAQVRLGQRGTCSVQSTAWLRTCSRASAGQKGGRTARHPTVWTRRTPQMTSGSTSSSRRRGARSSHSSCCVLCPGTPGETPTPTRALDHRALPLAPRLTLTPVRHGHCVRIVKKLTTPASTPLTALPVATRPVALQGHRRRPGRVRAGLTVSDLHVSALRQAVQVQHHSDGPHAPHDAVLASRRGGCRHRCR